MPKIVDHDQRRVELARAVWKVIGRDGIEGATVRRVAEEAGVSIGGMRHYFDSQRGLLRFAAEAMTAGVSARVAKHLHGVASGVDLARLILEECLPLDEERRVEADVWLACLVRSRVDDSMAELREQGWAGERHLCRLAIAYCREVRLPENVGDELGNAHLEQLAARLHVFLDGLTLQAALFSGQFPAAEVRALLRRELDLLSEGA